MAKRRRRGLRVRRQVRRLELWPVAKLALAFHLACGVVTLGALVVVWLIGRKLGTIDRAAKFLEDVGFAKDFEINGGVLLRAAAMVSGALVVVNTVGTLVLAFLYNSLSGILGGLIFSVLEEQPRTAASTRQRRFRREAVSAPGRATPDVVPVGRPVGAGRPPQVIASGANPSGVNGSGDRAAGDRTAQSPRPVAGSESDDWLAAARDGG